MSYYVKVDGEFVVPVENLYPLREFLVNGIEVSEKIPKNITERNIWCEDIRSFLKKNLALSFSLYKNSSLQGCINFEVNDTLNYNEEAFVEIMEKFSRFCTTVHIPEFYFRGEDDEIWKLVYDKEIKTVIKLDGQEIYEINTPFGELKVRSYDDGCANGIQILLNDEIITAVDVLKNTDNAPAEIRALVYNDGDEPKIINIEQEPEMVEKNIGLMPVENYEDMVRQGSRSNSNDQIQITKERLSKLVCNMLKWIGCDNDDMTHTLKQLTIKKDELQELGFHEYADLLEDEGGEN